MPRTPLDSALQQVADAYTAAGLRVVVDPQNDNPPCVYVALDQVDPAALSGDTYMATWNVLLIAPGVGQLAALKTLSDLEATAAAVLPPTDSTTAENFVTGDGGPPLPALAMTVETRVTPD